MKTKIRCPKCGRLFEDTEVSVIIANDDLGYSEYIQAICFDDFIKVRVKLEVYDQKKDET